MEKEIIFLFLLVISRFVMRIADSGNRYGTVPSGQ